jgi:hypothetical protein
MMYRVLGALQVAEGKERTLRSRICYERDCLGDLAVVTITAVWHVFYRAGQSQLTPERRSKCLGCW